MNSTYHRNFGSTVTSVLLLLMTAAASTDDALSRIANYKQWSQASQDLANDITTIDPNSIGG
jgi:hypothetical protein